MLVSLLNRTSLNNLHNGCSSMSKGPLEQPLIEAGVTVDKIHVVEVVGSDSCIPAILKILAKTFGKESRWTMNASECVARGRAL